MLQNEISRLRQVRLVPYWVKVLESELEVNVSEGVQKCVIARPTVVGPELQCALEACRGLVQTQIAAPIRRVLDSVGEVGPENQHF